VNATDATIPVEQSALDSAARGIDSAVFTLAAAQDVIETNGPAHMALEYLESSNENAQRALRLLISKGAHVTETPYVSDVPLHLLDTPAMRELTAKMGEAAKLAQIVDAERGHVLKGGEGCGWVDAVGDVYHRLRLEVYGPRGGGRE